MAVLKGRIRANLLVSSSVRLFACPVAYRLLGKKQKVVEKPKFTRTFDRAGGQCVSFHPKMSKVKVIKT